MIPATNNKLLIAEDWKKIYQSFRNADFKSYDFETLRRTMISYLQENYPEEFNDFIDSSEYIALIDLIAYLGQNLSFRVDLNARENFLETAQRRDSILRLAQLISYVPKRNTPASGLLKITAISTTDNVFDSNGSNLANATIGWNDPTNPDWYQQFINIINSAMTSSFGTPADKATVNGIPTEQYRINSSNEDTPIFSFSKNINGTPMSFEIVPSTFSDKEYIYEEAPEPAKTFGFVYRNDNQGSGSANTGFFAHFRQGSLNMAKFSLDTPVPNEIVGVNTPDINDTDVWLWQLDKNGNFSTLWSPVPSLIGNNVIYNSLNKSIRTIYAVSTRDEDQIDLNFADGVFGDLPKGEFRLFYRQSNGLTYTIKPEQMSSVVISVPYTNAIGQTHSLQLTLSLQYTVTNSSGPESNASIQSKAPQSYYIQNRMITGEDYNIAPLTAASDVLKVKSINRVSSGISKYFDIGDVTGRYSNTNIFSDDGILYKEETEKFFEFEFTSRNQILSMIKNQLAPVIASSPLKTFYYEKYSRPDLSSLSLTWTEVNKTPDQSRGYLKNSSNIFSVGLYSDSNLKYLESGAMVKFVAPAATLSTSKYFDENNNIKQVPASGIIPTGGKLYFWSSVVQVIGDGSNSGVGKLDDGTGPIIFGTRVPGDGTASNSAVPVEILSKYPSTLGFSIENEIANICLSQRNFGITIDQTTRSWSIILNSNLNLTDTFSLDNQNNVESLGLDASWIIAFVWTGKNYKVQYRNLEYVFESEQKTAFFINDTSVNYDFATNTVVKDKIDVLGVNPAAVKVDDAQWYIFPSSPLSWTTATTYAEGSYFLNTNDRKVYQKMNGQWRTGVDLLSQLGTDFTWQVESAIVESDGYIEPKKIKVSFYDYNNLGQLEDPDAFNKIVGDDIIHFKKDTDGLRYSLTTDLITNFDSESNWSPTVDLADGDLFYFYNQNEDVVKYWSATETKLKYTDEYFGKKGRSGLKFQYIHNSGDKTRIDPSKSNIIDVYVLTLSYDTEYRSWLLGNTNTQPKAPTSQTLEQNFKEKLEPIKAISDEIIFHPVKYKVLFGDSADPNLQATFKVVRNTDKPTTDNDIKTRVLTAINEFFTLENWEFGQTFYFSELSAYVMNNLSPDITNFVIVPKGNYGFGSLYEIASQSDEIFISGANINNIEVIDGITASQLKASTTIVTSSGT